MSGLRVAVVGAGAGEASDADLADALRVGALLAPHAIVVCGGRGGVMEAVSKGASESGGTVLGLLPYEDSQANPYLTLSVPTGLGEARNTVVVTGSQGVIAIGGKYGTLSEIGFALKLGRPVVGLHTWRLIDSKGHEGHFPSVETAEDAVHLMLKLLETD